MMSFLFLFHQKIAHTLQADCQCRRIMEQSRSSWHDDACNPQNDQTGIDTNDHIVVFLNALHQHFTQ